MYSVKQAAALTGVPEGTLRIWERRYGAVNPHRQDNGYRAYDDGQLALLRRMAGLVASGIPASRAAHLARGAVESGRTVEIRESTAQVLALAAANDWVGVETAVDALVGSRDFEDLVRRWLQPLMVDLGVAWETGQITVAQEHTVSGMLMRAVGGVFESGTVDVSAPVVLVGLPAGERHELVPFFFATCLRRQGVRVVWLGGDVPSVDLVVTARDLAPRAVVTAAHTAAAAQTVAALAVALSDQRPVVPVWVGGGAKDEATPARPMSDDVVTAAAALSATLQAGVA